MYRNCVKLNCILKLITHVKNCNLFIITIAHKLFCTGFHFVYEKNYLNQN